MNPNNCRISGLHTPIEPRLINSGSILICRFCKRIVNSEGKIIPTKPKVFDKDKVYSDLVKFYILKGYSKEHANRIATMITQKQIERHNKL